MTTIYVYEANIIIEKTATIGAPHYDLYPPLPNEIETSRNHVHEKVPICMGAWGAEREITIISQYRIIYYQTQARLHMYATSSVVLLTCCSHSY